MDLTGRRKDGRFLGLTGTEGAGDDLDCVGDPKVVVIRQ
jgi:hypothetical protein